MKKIINNNLYDTDTSIEVFKTSIKELVWNDWIKIKTKFYKTPTGKYFYSNNFTLFGKPTEINPISLTDIKEILKENDPDAYIREFGKKGIKKA